MPRARLFVGLTILSAAGLAAGAAPVRAQGLEITPFIGVRGGADLVEIEASTAPDRAGGPAAGVIVDVPLAGGLFVEGAFSHHKVDRLSTDHWQAGGLQEFLSGRARPFLTGMLGVTRYGIDGENEFRFLVAAGGGVKVFPARRVGIRVDGRVFATFVDADGGGIACGSISGTCFIALHLDMAWQAEATVGLVFRLR